MKHAVSTRALVRDAQRYVPELAPDDIRPGHFGIRAQALGRDGSLVDDFVFNQTGRVLHVRNAPSPGATASLAIARSIADRLAEGRILPTA
jgi:(S)-2-hydroxyglutarate dehydrogenase